MKPINCIVLAAGKGTRMKSDRPKVMHKVAGRPLVGHVLTSVAAVNPAQVALVVGPDMEMVADQATKAGLSSYRVALQQDRLGTGHAARIGLEALGSEAVAADSIVIVLFGDTPLIRSETIWRLAQQVEDGAAVAILGFNAAVPTGYGRLLVNDTGQVTGIREENDASDEEKKITLCNSGVMAFNSKVLSELLPQVRADNAKGEYYLTDVVGLAAGRGLRVAVETCAEEEVMGINNRLELSRAEARMQQMLREQMMLSGVTLIAPETVYFSMDTVIEPDVVIEPHVVFGPGVKVESGVVIHGFSHIEGATIGAGAQVGPFARLRPGTALAARSKVGNFVETKNAQVAEGAKINHLSYVGDAIVGAKANIGAGTITCNYDGFDKYVTRIGAGAFIGSNSALVAPVNIADGAFVGSGSVVVRDVEADALALARGEQVNKAGWAARFRAMKQAAKASKTAK
jgi:bifunctional UDP-N-acetylglucosamine pyrophosphorylase/glucosamine-1-phosphate N-acetyltransferase